MGLMGLPDNGWPLSYIPYQAASVALPCPIGLRPGAGGCGGAA
jgi:hypothetical protein